jgi:pilus assembly protein Flp/PilA
MQRGGTTSSSCKADGVSPLKKSDAKRNTYFTGGNMNQLVVISRNFFKEEDGVTAVEYALIASLIFLAIVASVVALGDKVSNTLYSGVVEEISNAMGGN